MRRTDGKAEKARRLLRRQGRQSRPALERILTRLAYRALAIGYRKAHLGDGWRRHFVAKANRLFDLALEAWRHA